MNNLKTLRRDAKLTQTSLSNLLGMTCATVSRWESGKRRLSAENAVRIDQVTDGKIPKEALRPDIFQPTTSPFFAPEGTP